MLLGDLRNDLLLINPVHFATQFQNATANTSIAGIVNVSVTLVTIVQDIAQGGLLGVAGRCCFIKGAGTRPRTILINFFN